VIPPLDCGRESRPDGECSGIAGLPNPRDISGEL
jgi:hypothetical protein